MIGPGRVGSKATTRAERIAVGSAFSFASMIVVRATALLNSIVVVRVLGLFDLGVYTIILLTISVGSLCATFGVPQAMVKFLAEVPADRPEDVGRLLGAASATTIAATACTAALLALLSPLLASLYNDSRIAELVLVASVGLVITSTISPILSTFQAFELIREIGIRNMASAGLSVPTTVTLVVIWGLNGAVLASVINSGISLLVNLSLLKSVWKIRKLSLMFPREWSVYRRILGFSIPAFAGSLLVTPVLWFTSTFLAIQSTFDEVGRYSVALGLASYLLFIPSAIGVPLFPIVSRLDRSKSSDVSPFLMKTLRIGAFLLIPPTLIFIALPEVLLGLLYGPTSVAAAPVVRVLAPAVFLAGVSSLLGYGIAGRGRMWDGLLLNLYWGVVLVLGAFILVPVGAAVGLSLAYLGAYVAHFLGGLAYLRYSWAVKLRPLAAPVLLATAAFGSLFAIELLLPTSWRLGMSIVVLATVVVIEFYTLSRRELEVLREPLRKLISWITQPP